MEAKQVIVCRTDLGMSRGKLAAQVSHGSLGCVLNRSHWNLKGNRVIETSKNDDLYAWLNGRFTKIVLEVKDEKELLEIYDKAIKNDLNAVLIKDAGLTEFKEPTYTCVGIGPHFPEIIDEVTGHLKTFR